MIVYFARSDNAKPRWYQGMNLENSIVVVTGGARGLGASMALRLARAGARLVLVDVDPDALADTADECRAAGAPAVMARNANVSDEGEVEALFAEVREEFGALHGLVNNAGITRDALLVKYKDGRQVSKMTVEQWQAVIDVNLTGVFLCGREAAATMIETGSPGCIINISSISRAGNMGQTNYSAAKAGVHAMAVAWARELARYGIRAASIAPGFIGTEMVMAMKPEAREKLTAGIPAGRIGYPDEIAATVQFIFENDYVSGRCLDVDGGLRL